MRKIITLILLIMVPLLITGCGNNNKEKAENTTQKNNDIRKVIKKTQEEYNNEFNTKVTNNLQKLVQKYGTGIVAKILGDETKEKKFVYLKSNKKIEELYGVYSDKVLEYLQKSLYNGNSNSFMFINFSGNKLKINFDKFGNIKSIIKYKTIKNENFKQDFLNSPDVKLYKAYQHILKIGYNKIKQQDKKKILDNVKNNFELRRAIEDVFHTKNETEFKNRIKELKDRIKEQMDSFRTKTIEIPIKDIKIKSFEKFIQELNNKNKDLINKINK